jgi:hypothetical protein
MLRTCSRIIALTAMVAGPSMTAQPADAMLTLARQGTGTSGTEDSKPEPISMGIIVNFTARTVTGFTYPGADFPMTITMFDDVHILFSGSNKSGNWTILGSIDRVTGDVAATSTRSRLSTSYELKCRPAQRMF